MSWPFLLCGQFSAASSIFWTDGFRKVPGPIGSTAYPALQCRVRGASFAATGNRLFGTELGQYEASCSMPFQGHGLGLLVSRAGSSVMYESTAILSFAKRLDDDFSMAVTMGLSSFTAQGYYSAFAAKAGLGFSWDISERCRWLLQADDLIALFRKESLGQAEIRSGLGYRFSEHLEGSVQALIRPEHRSFFLLALSYRPTDLLGFRMGYSKDLFMAGAMFSHRQLELHVQTSWHMVMGFSQGFGLAYQKRSKP